MIGRGILVFGIKFVSIGEKKENIHCRKELIIKHACIFHLEMITIDVQASLYILIITG